MSATINQQEVGTTDLMDKIKALVLDSTEPYAIMTALHGVASAAMDLGDREDGDAIDTLVEQMNRI